MSPDGDKAGAAGAREVVDSTWVEPSGENFDQILGGAARSSVQSGLPAHAGAQEGPAACAWMAKKRTLGSGCGVTITRPAPARPGAFQPRARALQPRSASDLGRYSLKPRRRHPAPPPGCGAGGGGVGEGCSAEVLGSARPIEYKSSAEHSSTFGVSRQCQPHGNPKRVKHLQAEPGVCSAPSTARALLSSSEQCRAVASTPEQCRALFTRTRSTSCPP
jgi:hypothetical protein